ncbi:MAG: hypothetical protein Q8940_18375, partial [Bacteroidota bacterium]|nr:hypothetical protein [Bacteroidota bacterium]
NHVTSSSVWSIRPDTKYWVESDLESELQEVSFGAPLHPIRETIITMESRVKYFITPIML